MIRKLLMLAAMSLVLVSPSYADELTAPEQRLISLFETSRASVVSITTGQRRVDPWQMRAEIVPSGSGSGFFWGDDGHVVTNAHVIQRATRADVHMANGQVLPAQLIGTAAQYDLAVLKVDLNGEAPAPVSAGESAGLKVGQSVLIGVNTAIFSPSGASSGIGFAVPVDLVKRVVPQLIATGVYRPPVIGIRIDPRINALARQNGIEGVVVMAVTPNGPADIAGLKPAQRSASGGIVAGDVIQKINDRDIASAEDLSATLDDYNPGDEVTLTLWRDGALRDVSVVLIYKSAVRFDTNLTTGAVPFKRTNAALNATNGGRCVFEPRVVLSAGQSWLVVGIKAFFKQVQQ